MPTQVVLEIEAGYEQDIVVLVQGKTITFHNTATDATAFSFDIGVADWEEVKGFVDEKLKEK